jgi:hypothetical protein
MAAAQQLMDTLQEQINAMSSAEEGEMDADATPPPRQPIPVIEVRPMAVLPVAKPVEEGDLPHYAFAARVLDHHAIQDQDFPLSIGDIGLPRASLALLVGADLWTQHFPGDAPDRSARLPRRLLGAIKVAMTRLALSTQACAEVEEARVTGVVAAAAKAYDEWRAEPNAAQPSQEPY